MELSVASQLLKDRGVDLSSGKKPEAPTTQTPATPVAEDKERLDNAIGAKPVEVEKPAGVVAEKEEDLVDLSKEPEAGPSIQEKAKVEAKVVKEIKKPEENIEVTKNWFDDDADVIAEGVTEKKVAEIPADTKARLEEYEALMKDPEIEAIIAAKKSGKNLFDFIEEIKPVDYNKLSEEKLFEISLKKLGVTDEAITEALEEFRELPKWKQAKEVADVKTSLEREQSERLKKFPQDVARQMEARNNFIKKAELELDKSVDNIVGKELYGMKITDSEANAIKDTVKNGIAFYKQDGSFDVQKSIEHALWDKFKKEIVRANINKARASNAEEFFKERVRPTAKTIETQRQPVATEDGKLKEAKESYMKRMLENYS